MLLRVLRTTTPLVRNVLRFFKLLIEIILSNLGNALRTCPNAIKNGQFTDLYRAVSFSNKQIDYFSELDAIPDIIVFLV